MVRICQVRKVIASFVERAKISPLERFSPQGSLATVPTSPFLFCGIPLYYCNMRQRCLGRRAGKLTRKKGPEAAQQKEARGLRAFNGTVLLATDKTSANNDDGRNVAKI